MVVIHCYSLMAQVFVTCINTNTESNIKLKLSSRGKVLFVSEKSFILEFFSFKNKTKIK